MTFPFLYRPPAPEDVKFQRLFMGALAIASIFLRDTQLLTAFLALSIVGLFTGTAHSPVTALLKLIQLTGLRPVRITEHHLRYYQINRQVDMVDHAMRIGAAAGALALMPVAETLAWGLVAFLCVFMLISAYFGFCLSALTYIAYRQLFQKGGAR